MNAMEAMLTRKSIKKYKTDPVPKELIEQVIAAGLNAPSGLNKQSPIILAVTDRQVRDELSKLPSRQSRLGKLIKDQPKTQLPEDIEKYIKQKVEGRV